MGSAYDVGLTDRACRRRALSPWVAHAHPYVKGLRGALGVLLLLVVAAVQDPHKDVLPFGDLLPAELRRGSSRQTRSTGLRQRRRETAARICDRVPDSQPGGTCCSTGHANLAAVSLAVSLNLPLASIRPRAAMSIDGCPSAGVCLDGGLAAALASRQTARV